MTGQRAAFGREFGREALSGGRRAVRHRLRGQLQFIRNLIGLFAAGNTISETKMPCIA